MRRTRAAAARRSRTDAELRRTAEIIPPEGVPLHFEIAGLGARLAAQLIDILITFGLALATVLLVLLIQRRVDAGLFAVIALLFFAVRVPYYVAAELIWNGQTLGKRICALRVISGNGRSLSVHQIVARNLMKEMEVFLPGTYLLTSDNLGTVASALVLAWIAVLIAVPLFNKRRQRVGDLVGETIVVHQPRKLLEPDLATAAVAPAGARFVFLPHQLEHYGAYELQVLEKVLQGGERARNAAEHDRNEANLTIIFDRIRAKIGYDDRVARAERGAFLRAFYVAQRAHLEQRQLFGDVRRDKFHRESKIQAKS
jgi:uncharacterized RDD family membrane protein YckC